MIIEKDVCPCGPLIWVGRVEIWGKWMRQLLSFFFLPISGRRGKRGKEQLLVPSPLTHKPAVTWTLWISLPVINYGLLYATASWIASRGLKNQEDVVVGYLEWVSILPLIMVLAWFILLCYKAKVKIWLPQLWTHQETAKCPWWWITSKRSHVVGSSRTHMSRTEKFLSWMIFAVSYSSRCPSLRREL